MPGPVSDSYDPVWSTSANREEVIEAVSQLKEMLGRHIGSEPRYILDVVREENGKATTIALSERQMRILRFALRVALEEDEL